MGASISITKSNLFEAMRNFLLSVLPSDVEVVSAQDNRVSEPKSDNFVTMTSAFRERLSTNIDSNIDVKFTGSISTTVLTVSSIFFGVIVADTALLGVNVAAGTRIIQQLTGTPGGVGTYELNKSQIIASQVIASGYSKKLQPTQATIQLDIHGPDSAENTQIVSTLFRDEYGVNFFKNSGYDIAPLYTNDPRQIAFNNSEQQYEDRWILEAIFEVDPSVSVSQDFADAVTVNLIDIDATYAL